MFSHDSLPLPPSSTTIIVCVCEKRRLWSDGEYAEQALLVDAISIKISCAGPNTVKPALSGHPKRRPNICFEDRVSLNAGQSIAECSKRAFFNTLDLH